MGSGLRFSVFSTVSRETEIKSLKPIHFYDLWKKSKNEALTLCHAGCRVEGWVGSEGQRHNSDLNLIAVVQLDRLLDPRPVDRRPVLAAEVVEHGALRRDLQFRV